MKTLFASLVLVLSVANGYAQFTYDRELHWKTVANCAVEHPDAPVFKTVEVPPTLLSIPENAFVDTLVRIARLAGSADGTVRLKLWLASDGTICLHALGTSQELPDDQHMEIFAERFPETLSFNPGLQRGNMRNCEAIITMYFTVDKLLSYRIVNLAFSG